MWGKQNRARLVNPVWRTTDLAKHEEYIEREHGLNNSMVAQILEDPEAAFFEGGQNILAITQAISWHRIASTGKTNIPVAMDAVASGYAHMLADMRDPELFVRAFPFLKDFVHPHWTLALGLRKATNALRTLSLNQIIPLSKFVFTPCMYGAGQDGLMSHATGEVRPEDLCDCGDWDEFDLPPLMHPIIGHLEPAEKANLLYLQCKEWASVFRRKMPKVHTFGDWWMKEWKNKSDAKGMWLEGVDGTLTLCPKLRRNKHETVEYSAEWWENGEKVEDNVSLFAPRVDEEGTAVSSARIQTEDSWQAADTVIDASGKVMESIHDSMVFMLADEPEVQGSFTQAFIRQHAYDPMRTGKPALDIDPRLRMLR